MRIQSQHLFFFLLSLLFLLPPSTVTAPIRIWYGRRDTTNDLSSNGLNLLKSNGISRLRLFDADPKTLKALSNTGIELMITVPNQILPSLATGTVNTSLQWLQTNIFAHVPTNQVRYIAVGNEIFLKEPHYTPYVVPAIAKLYESLQTLNLANTIKLSSPHAASVLSNSDPPSSGTFDPFLKPAIVPLLKFLQKSKSPLMVNVYPYISYAGNKAKSVFVDDNTLFKSADIIQDGKLLYSNLFDVPVDAFMYAMEREGITGVPVIVAETGWPTAGGRGANNPDNAWLKKVTTLLKGNTQES